MDWLGKYPDNPAQKFLGENNTRQRHGAGMRPSLARVPRVPRSHRTAIRCAARPRPGALELLLRLGRVGDGRQRYRGSRRRLVQDRRRGPALQPARSVRHGARSAIRRCRRSSTWRIPTNMSATPHAASRRRRSASRSTERGGTSSSRTSSRSKARARRPQPIRPRVHRQAFVYLVSTGKTADNGQVAKVDGIRRAWEAILPSGDRQADAGDHDAALRRRRRASTLTSPSSIIASMKQLVAAILVALIGRALRGAARFVRQSAEPSSSLKKLDAHRAAGASRRSRRKSCRAPSSSSAAAIASCTRKRSATARSCRQSSR